MAQEKGVDPLNKLGDNVPTILAGAEGVPVGAPPDLGVPPERINSLSDTDVDLEKEIPPKSEKANANPDIQFHKRSWYERIPFVSTTAAPPPHSIDDARPFPISSVSFLSRLTFNWMNPLMQTGYARPLQPSDLWKLDDKRTSGYIAGRIDASWIKRVAAAEEYNRKLDNGEINPPMLKRAWWTLKGKRQESEELWRSKYGRKHPSLLKALNDAIGYWFWTGIFVKVFADGAQICSPLLIKAIIKFSTESYAYYSGFSPNEPAVGRGIGLSFALIFLLMFSSLTLNHSMYHLASAGVLLRGGLIAAIADRSLQLTNKARSHLSNGKLIAHLSTDVSRIDFALSFSMGATAPLQIAICLGLLIDNLGWCALPGFGLFFVVTPLQTLAMKKLFSLRKAAMVWTDKRSKLLQELLGGMRVIKYFAWEIPFLRRIGEYRQKEITQVRGLLVLRSIINALAFSLPVMAAIVSFVSYSASGHPLDPAVIFTSLTFFQLLRLPLMLLPVTLSAGTDAINAVGRLQGLFEAELQGEMKHIDPELPVAIKVENASFSWDAPPPEDASGSKKKGGAGKDRHGKKKAAPTATPVGEERIFQLKNIDLEIPYGKLVAVVGAVGSGKSSLLQGLIGEMRRTSGNVSFGGPVAYCPQMAWIQSNSIRDNILFGRPFDEDRYWKAIRDSELEADLSIFPAGDMTEVGERGISLSGGQKQRINVARALYCSHGITLFDDPLSALDAHVGEAVFHQVILGALAGTTRILVTHALHYLPMVDYIIVMDGKSGTISERGTYNELVQHEGAFAKFLKEFASEDDQEKKDEVEEDAIEAVGKKTGKDSKAAKGIGGSSGGMQDEERMTGAVKYEVYKAYFSSGYGRILVPILLFSLLFSQAANVMNSYWLVFWQENKWPYGNGFYMGVYGALGVAQAFGMFMLGISFTMMTYFASKHLHARAIDRILHAPMSFFDTTPLGRIMNRFTKDIDVLDNLITDAFRMLAGTAGQIVSSIVLVAVVLPYFLIPVAVILVLYYWGSVFYRASARELKRLDALLRSSLYAHYAESLTGLPTIRAYSERDRFLLETRSRVDIENRAYLLTVINQRWLGLRLDFLGSSLTFFVALLSVLSRNHISPSQTGLVLSYMLVVQQSFGWFVRQLAEVENDSNSVERLLYYSREIETEAPNEKPEAKPANWPKGGNLSFKNVKLSYRPGLPTVLDVTSLDIKAGESIGIVGRSGAGKSTIMVALYRLVELSVGSIELDGVDISTLGLDDLRRNLAIIPQDPLLFSGTIRTNLDPFGIYDDAMLWGALRRAHLVESNDTVTQKLEDEGEASTAEGVSNSRFTLDTVVEEEGANLSVGQRSLVSLARAIVTPATITLLDEATASVDYATDQLIQETIAREFRDRTLLCIAHRLRTILGYDRVCVMDAGKIAEFDEPLKLYQNPNGIFRSMCDRSGIGEKDIRAAME